MGIRAASGFKLSNNGGYIIPCSMKLMPSSGEQTENINALGTNLLGPLLNATPPADLSYTLSNGKVISIHKNYPGGSYNIDFGGYLSLNNYGAANDFLGIIAYPMANDLDDITNLGLLEHYSSGYYILSNDSAGLRQLFEDTLGEEPEGSDTIPSGGNGQMDIQSNDIPFPALPVKNFLDTHMISLYNPTTAEMQSLNTYLWSSSFYQNIEKIFNDPMEAIIGFYMLPVTPTSSAANIRVGTLDTGVSSKRVSQQYYYINFGKIDIGEYFGTFYDYAPYTRAEIYLPFIGSRELDIGEIMGCELWLQYMVDVLTGSCTAMLHVERLYKKNFRENLNAILYQWNGNMAIQGAISAKNYTEFYKTVINSISTGVMVGMAAPVGGAAAAGVAVGTAAGGMTKLSTTAQPIQHCGNLGGDNGMLGVQFPYITLSRPNIAVPENICHDGGLRSEISGTVSSFSGFTKFSNIHVDGISQATDAERDEIEKLLKEGIII